jgi:hypothetical protein
MRGVRHISAQEMIDELELHASDIERESAERAKALRDAADYYRKKLPAQAQHDERKDDQ